jgi:hypothetical protein
MTSGEQPHFVRLASWKKQDPLLPIEPNQETVVGRPWLKQLGTVVAEAHATGDTGPAALPQVVVAGLHGRRRSVLANSVNGGCHGLRKIVRQALPRGGVSSLSDLRG